MLLPLYLRVTTQHYLGKNSHNNNYAVVLTTSHNYQVIEYHYNKIIWVWHNTLQSKQASILRYFLILWLLKSSLPSWHRMINFSHYVAKIKSLYLRVAVNFARDRNFAGYGMWMNQPSQYWDYVKRSFQSQRQFRDGEVSFCKSPLKIGFHERTCNAARTYHV